MVKPKSDPAPSVYQIKITLVSVAPPVWRRVEIEDCPLETLHGVIQDAMGWENYHLYEFRIDDVVYTNPLAVDEDKRSAAAVTLGQVVEGKHVQFDYVYDMGDQWEHQIEIEAIRPPQPDVHYPRCVEGGRACPPEDCGGPGGYADMLVALKDPEHEEHEDFLEWIGDDFDPEAFDAQQVNRIWASWDFSDPNSGPSYDQADSEPEMDVEEHRAKAKAKAEAKTNPQPRVAKNDPCPCGSGKKYKKCCFKKGKDGNYDDD